MLVRFLYGAAALLAASGAVLITWAAAYRPLKSNAEPPAFSIGGPFRYVRNPQYLSYFLLLLALGTFQSRLGFPVMLVGETILLLRLIAREEMLLEAEYGERFRAYARGVPRLLPALRPRFDAEAQPAHWRQALWEQAFQWGLVATLVAFACTLSDRIGYAFAGATMAFFLLQKLAQMLWMHLRRTGSSGAGA
jgi:hypothetical protein